ncbi:hypothetical protein GTY44_16510 [Streptomyces sp. SID5914]|nr:hypothetical protein [Streptomyces sp. SID5914]MZG15070.1 hypothetical protein [Streptomyces sp. SID5914]
MADLTTALEIENLLARDADGQLRLGARVAEMAGDGPLIDRVLRRLSQTAQLDGHTVSLVRPAGIQGICVDVRMGRHPLPLTPRPGQASPLTDSAGAIAVVRGLPEDAARDLIARHAAHQGITPEAVQDALTRVAAARRDNSGAVHLTDTHGVLQIGCPLRERALAVVVHLPDRLAAPALLEELSGTLSGLCAVRQALRNISVSSRGERRDSH